MASHSCKMYGYQDLAIGGTFIINLNCLLGVSNELPPGNLILLQALQTVYNPRKTIREDLNTVRLKTFREGIGY